MRHGGVTVGRPKVKTTSNVVGYPIVLLNTHTHIRTTL